jgi:hypothetical protein
MLRLPPSAVTHTASSGVAEAASVAEVVGVAIGGMGVGVGGRGVAVGSAVGVAGVRANGSEHARAPSASRISGAPRNVEEGTDLMRAFSSVGKNPRRWRRFMGTCGGDSNLSEERRQ